MPLAALNQVLIWDELCAGRAPRWVDSGEQGAQDIDAMLSAALTGGA